MNKLFKKAKQVVGAVETTEQSPEFIAAEDQLKETTHMYKDVLKHGQLLKKREQDGAQPLLDLSGLL